MRQTTINLLVIAMTAFKGLSAQSQHLNFLKVKAFEHQLDDVMELIDTTEIKTKLKVVEANYKQNPNEMNAVKLGIIYHETALNLSFFSKTTFKGYAKKSYDILSDLSQSPATTKELMPFIASYRASSLALVGSETKKIGLLFKAFSLFKDAVQQYSSVSYMPEFLRGSVAENIPKIFFWLHKYGKLDFNSIITKQEKNAEYANGKVMSFVYWAWAKQRQNNKDNIQSLIYLDKAIALDPQYKAGRKKAEELKIKLTK
jgi:hypothetical protein